MTARVRVAVDLLYYTGRRGGTETYARGLYAAAGDAAAEFEFIGITNREMSEHDLDWFPGTTVGTPISGRNRGVWAAGECLAVAEIARQQRADVLHCPANFGPVFPRLSTVVTIHDLLPLEHPSLAGPLARVTGALSRCAGRRAARVLTDSQASAASIVRHLSIPPTRVNVVPLAASSSRAQAGKPPPGVATAGRPVVLSTGNRLPHKNFKVLLRAWAATEPTARPLLALTGGGDRDPLGPLVRDLGLEDDVLLLGWLSPGELEAVYAAADLYVCPSQFEGFGLPVLESMTRGVPVLSSDIPVLREVGGQAARYVAADDPAAWRDSIREVLDSPAIRADMRGAGERRASGYSWARTAEQTLEVFRAVVRAGRSR